MGGGKNDFFITATIRELASVTGHAIKRWRFAPFDKFTFHFPMRMPDVTIFGCTPDITIRTNCQRTRLIQRAGCTSKFSTGNQVSSGLCYITRCGYFFSKMFCSPTGHNSFYRPILDVVHPVSRLEGSDLMYLTCSAMMDCITWPTGALSTRLRSSRLMFLLCCRQTFSFCRVRSAVKFSATFVAQGVMISL